MTSKLVKIIFLCTILEAKNLGVAKVVSFPVLSASTHSSNSDVCIVMELDSLVGGLPMLQKNSFSNCNGKWIGRCSQVLWRIEPGNVHPCTHVLLVCRCLPTTAGSVHLKHLKPVAFTPMYMHISKDCPPQVPRHISPLRPGWQQLDAFTLQSL